jgi:hypothetical protein
MRNDRLRAARAFIELRQRDRGGSFASMNAPLPTSLAVPPALARFCLGDDAAYVVPAECLGPDGLEPALAALLQASGRANAAQLDVLAEGFARYWTRCAALHAAAPRAWFAPRRTNLLVVADERPVLPYLEPFAGTSSMLYASDLDTDAEYVAALLVHMERLALLHHVPATVCWNLSYWFTVDTSGRAAFAAAARRARRPDAAAFVALAEALSWIDEVLHDPLRPPQGELTEPHFQVQGADLYVPRRLREPFVALGQAAEAALREGAPAPAVVARTGAALDALCDWLTAQRAHVIVHGPNGGTLWTPQHDDPVRVRNMLKEAPDAAVASIHADLEVVHARSRQFLDRVDAAALPTHCAVLETGGGAYVDPARRAVVYELQQPAFDARAGMAPPCHRLLLGSRVMHEWGHVAHTAKIVRLPEERRADYRAARAELGERFVALLARVPPALQAAVEEELAGIEPRREERAAALAKKTLARVGDYLANLISSRLIPAEEMQAYVRTNVRHHLDEQLGLVSELARYAYEVHYLGLVGLPRSYFYETSRFPDQFVATGILPAAEVDALFDAAGRVLACYAIDTARLRLD